MKNTTRNKLVLGCSVLCFLIGVSNYSWAASSNIERERRLEQQALDTLFIGSEERLAYSGGDFLTLTSDNDPIDNIGVILMHGRGHDANTPTVIKPLREALEDQGWFHISMQMPVLEKDAKYYDYLATFPDAKQRIDAAIKALQAKQVSKIIIIAHSCSVHMSMNWLNNTEQAEIDAFIGIGMGATDFGQPMKSPLPLNKLSVPILDIFGASDYPAVLRLAPERLTAMQDTRLSKQIIVPEANHDFTGTEDILNAHIISWIETIAQ